MEVSADSGMGILTRPPAGLEVIPKVVVKVEQEIEKDRLLRLLKAGAQSSDVSAEDQIFGEQLVRAIEAL